MAYSPQTWVDLDPSKPLSAARMTVIEDGIASVHTVADAHATQLAGAGVVDTRLDAVEAQLAGAGTVDTRLDALEAYAVSNLFKYTVILHGGTGVTNTLTAAATYFFNEISNPATTIAGNVITASNCPVMMGWEAADFAITGFTTKFKIRCSVFVNGTAPATTFTVSLNAISAAGGNYQTGAPLGAVAITTPAANSEATIEGADFDVPADGQYALAMVPTANPAASSITNIFAQLTYHHV